MLRALEKQPLFDILSLRSHLEDLAVTDSACRDLEDRLQHDWMESERLPLDEALFLRAVSRHWIYAAYEMLRSWRQISSRLLGLIKALSRIEDHEQRQRLVEDFRREADPRSDSPMRRLDPSYEKYLERAQTDSTRLSEQLEFARDRLLPLLQHLEPVRVALAKGEVQAGPRTVVFGAGYARFDRMSGSALFFGSDSEGHEYSLSRRELSDDLQADLESE